MGRGGRQEATREARRGQAHRRDDLEKLCVKFKDGRNAVEDPSRLRLSAPRLAGSAAHPVSPGPNKQRRRVCAVHQHPARAIMTRATSEIAKAKDSHLERRWALLSCSCRQKGGACRFSSPAHEIMLPIQSARGALGVKRRALRSGPQGLRDRARHQLRSSFGALRGVPARRGSGRRNAARAQGKAFPSQR